MDELSPCPFCGSARAVELITAAELWADMDVEISDTHMESFAVVCSAWKEGCGATGGFMLDREGAAVKWNNRTNTHSAVPVEGDPR